MQTVKAYVYNNKVEVQVLDTTIFTVRNRKVYSRPIKIYQGIDNPIQVIVKNQEQKAVNLSGYILQADLQDPVNQVAVVSVGVEWLDITKGQGRITIAREDIDGLEQRFYKLTFKTIKTSDNTEKPTYIDDNYGVPLDLQVLPAYYATTEAAAGTDETIVDGGLL